MMRKSETPRLDAAEAEASRFLARVNALRAATKAREAHGGYSTPIESGAVRRASMDLTRALADLRRGI